MNRRFFIYCSLAFLCYHSGAHHSSSFWLSPFGATTVTKGRVNLSCVQHVCFCAIISTCFFGFLRIGNETCSPPPQWGAADAETKVPSGENTGLKPSPFKAWSWSVCSHTCYAYCQEFLPSLFLPFQSIHLHFPKPLPIFFLRWLWLTWVPV